jgi:hypothetical protein
MVTNLTRGAGLRVELTWDEEWGYQVQVEGPGSAGDPCEGCEEPRTRILYQGRGGDRFDAWAHGYCVGRGLL